MHPCSVSTGAASPASVAGLLTPSGPRLLAAAKATMLSSASRAPQPVLLVQRAPGNSRRAAVTAGHSANPARSSPKGANRSRPSKRGAAGTPSECVFGCMECCSASAGTGRCLVLTKIGGMSSMAATPHALQCVQAPLVSDLALMLDHGRVAACLDPCAGSCRCVSELHSGGWLPVE